jgi:hypothetical protein
VERSQECLKSMDDLFSLCMRSSVQINKKSKLLKSLCPESTPTLSTFNDPVQACIYAEVQVLISVGVVLDSAADMLI